MRGQFVDGMAAARVLNVQLRTLCQGPAQHMMPTRCMNDICIGIHAVSHLHLFSELPSATAPTTPTCCMSDLCMGTPMPLPFYNCVFSALPSAATLTALAHSLPPHPCAPCCRHNKDCGGLRRLHRAAPFPGELSRWLLRRRCACCPGVPALLQR